MGGVERERLAVKVQDSGESSWRSRTAKLWCPCEAYGNFLTQQLLARPIGSIRTLLLGVSPCALRCVLEFYLLMTRDGNSTVTFIF